MKKYWTSLKEGMKLFGENIAILVNTILLLFVYVIGVGMTSLVAKAVGKHFLMMKKKDSYWEPLDLKKRPKDEHLRQF